jgi:aminoglycoside phosphotransferase (APT) family kinase protein
VDIEQPDELVAYLRATGRIGPRESITVETLAGGVSNRTVRVTRSGGESWVLKQALGKLRVAADWFCDPARIHREADGLRALGHLVPESVPAFVFEDEDAHVLAMSAVPAPHANFKTLLLTAPPDPALVAAFGALLGQIHRAAREQAATLAPRFADSRFFEALRLEPYYAYTAAQAPEAATFLHALIAETWECRETLVHGDYSPKNVLVHDGHLVLLDFEVIHWGDPAFDVGFGLTHLLSKAHHRPALRREFLDAARTFWRAYRGAGGFAEEVWAVRHTLACLLARVAGRSPLEYLDAAERARQRRAVGALLTAPPASIDELATAFAEALDA